jgi:hypothetical protein
LDWLGGPVPIGKGVGKDLLVDDNKWKSFHI